MTSWINTLILTLLLCIGFTANGLATEQHVDLVKVDKSARKMYLIQGDRIVRWYHISLGANPKGHKLREGDQRTPEGRYLLDFINEKSRFYRSIRINYPNENDVKRAQKLGVNPGGQIMIHGQKDNNDSLPGSGRSKDWTDGCIAIANEEMDELLRLVKLGTPIDIEW